MGKIPTRIPKVREWTYVQRLLEPRWRSEKALLAGVLHAYGEGVSTGRVDHIELTRGRGHLSLCRRISGPPVSLRTTVEAFEQTLLELDPAVLRSIPTGFPHLDANTGGGFHAEDLVLVVGKQNVGKTLFVCQLGRNIACWAARRRNRVICLLICYDHSPLLLLQRLLCMES